MLRHFLELVPRASVRQEERMRNSPANVFCPDGEPHVVCDLSSMHISAPLFLPPPFAWCRMEPRDVAGAAYYPPPQPGYVSHYPHAYHRPREGGAAMMGHGSPHVASVFSAVPSAPPPFAGPYANPLHRHEWMYRETSREVSPERSRSPPTYYQDGPQPPMPTPRLADPSEPQRFQYWRVPAMHESMQQVHAAPSDDQPHVVPIATPQPVQPAPFWRHVTVPPMENGSRDGSLSRMEPVRDTDSWVRNLWHVPTTDLVTAALESHRSILSAAPPQRISPLRPQQVPIVMGPITAVRSISPPRPARLSPVVAPAAAVESAPPPTGILVAQRRQAGSSPQIPGYSAVVKAVAPALPVLDACSKHVYRRCWFSSLAEVQRVEWEDRFTIVESEEALERLVLREFWKLKCDAPALKRSALA